MIHIITVLAALTLSAAQSSSAYLGNYTQPLREGTAEIHGQVLDALSQKPIPDLEVEIIEVDAGGRRGPGIPARHAITHTDSTGKFSIARIGAGAYITRVTGATHLEACLGTTQPKTEACARIHVDEDEIQRDVVIYARPAAIIRGRVLDYDGRPFADAFVSACSDSEGCAEPTKSDTGGRFEIGAIPPSNVHLSVEMPLKNGGSEHAYYPGVWELDKALPIAVIAGQPANIEFHLPKLVMGSISARVSGPEGFHLDEFELSQSDRMMQALSGTADRVDNLREGRYLVHALGSVGGKHYAGFKAVDVSDGVAEAFIQLEEAGVVDGRIVAQGGGIPPLSDLRISAWWWLDDDVVGAVLGDVSRDGVFAFTNLLGDRTFRIFLAPGWRIVKVSADGKDVTDDVVHVGPGSRVQVTITVGRN